VRNLDDIGRVWNCVRLGPGLRRARSLGSGASDGLIVAVLPAEWGFVLPSQGWKMAEGSSSS